jgi:hypothetical protein
MQIQPNSIEFQTLELPRILIKILARILESSYKENCSLFNFHHSHILIEIFRIQEVHLLTAHTATPPNRRPPSSRPIGAGRPDPSPTPPPGTRPRPILDPPSPVHAPEPTPFPLPTSIGEPHQPPPSPLPLALPLFRARSSTLKAPYASLSSAALLEPTMATTGDNAPPLLRNVATFDPPPQPTAEPR